jgi:hypothetical protein
MNELERTGSWVIVVLSYIWFGATNEQLETRRITDVQAGILT